MPPLGVSLLAWLREGHQWFFHPV